MANRVVLKMLDFAYIPKCSIVYRENADGIVR